MLAEVLEIPRLEPDEVFEFRIRKACNYTIRPATIAVPDLSEKERTMSLDVSLGNKQGAVIGFVAELVDGTPVDPQPTFSFNGFDGSKVELLDTMPDGTALAANTKFFRPMQPVHAADSFGGTVEDGTVSLAVNFNVAGPSEDHIAGNVTLVDL